MGDGEYTRIPHCFRRVRDTLYASMERIHDEEMEVKASEGSGRMVRMAAAFAIVAALGFAGGVTVAAQGGTNVFSNVPLLGDGLSAEPDESANLSTFWKAWNALNDRYVGSTASSTMPNVKDKLWGAIQGLTNSYGDPYTIFLPPEDAKIFQEDISGSFEGVGMEIGINGDGVLTVIAPLKGTPAERAGLHSGDQILSIDGRTTDGLSTDEAVKLIRGPKGTTVTFTIYRDGAPLEIQVTRDAISVPTIEHSLDVDSGVYVISLYSFTANAQSQFNQALASFRRSGSNKLLIDLRGNPGGYLESAVSMAGNFLPKGSEVVTEDYRGKRENIVHRSKGVGGVPEGTRVAILIDQGSASASEILAGALQDAGVATLIGTRSFGKGSVQELVEIDGGSLKVTVARWLTPAGRSISDGGLTPDIEVTRTREDAAAGRDPQKARAIEFLASGR